MLDALIDGNADLGIPAMTDGDALADLRTVRELFGPVADQLGALATDRNLVGAGDGLPEQAFARENLIMELSALAAKVQGNPL